MQSGRQAGVPAIWVAVLSHYFCGADTRLSRWFVPVRKGSCQLIPFYKLAEGMPSMRQGALRLGLVTIENMIGALVRAVETPAAGVRVVEVPEIRSCESPS